MTPARWRVTLWIAALLGVALLLHAAARALIPFLFGGAIAYSLLPIVDRLSAAVPLRNETLRRGLAVALCYLVFGALLLIALSWLLPIVTVQVSNFVQTLPRRVDAAHGFLTGLLEHYRTQIPNRVQARFNDYVNNVAAAISGALTASARRSFSVFTGTVSLLFGYFVVPFWMFYAMRDRYSLARSLMGAVPPPLRPDVGHAWVIVDHVVGRYIRGQLLLGLLVGVASGVGLSLLHVQLSLGLGVWSGVAELIPILGPWIGAIPGLIVVASTNPHLLLPVFLLYLAVQNVESHLLLPRVQGQAMSVPAALVIILLVVSGAAFGFLGLVVAVPAAAILRELFWYADRRLAGATPHEAFAQSRAARLTTARGLPKRVSSLTHGVSQRLRGRPSED